MPSEVTRHITNAVSNMLWGRAAGRCEFPSCNKPLWKSPVTQEPVNIAERAHIWSFSADGPRGHKGIAATDLSSCDNLMLVCHDCHKKIDRFKDGGRYPPGLLQQWKTEHEARIELVTGIDPGRRSEVLLYGANVGDHSGPLSFGSAASALFPGRYPASDRAIHLGMINSALRDRDPDFWRTEEKTLRRQFDQYVRGHLATGDIRHLSVFGLAPQPLLILLGSLLTDITAVDVYQLRREPQGWAWADTGTEVSLIVERPTNVNGPPALVLSLSATITVDRIRSVVGEHVSIWTVTLPVPHNDWLQTRSQLRTFRETMRPLLDQIKAAHGQATTLSVFPAMPVASAVELGRIRMPKADMPWRIYDQVNDSGGFIPALEIGPPSDQEVA